MASARIITISAVVFAFNIIIIFKASSGSAAALPDSAGIVEMVDGLAYGGIPYGSISGMLKNPISNTQEVHYTYNDLQHTSLHIPNPRIAQDIVQVIGPTNSVGY